MKTPRFLFALILLSSLVKITNAQWVSNGPYNCYLGQFAFSESNVYVGGQIADLFLSADGGNSWAQVPDGLSANSTAFALAAHDSMIIIGDGVGDVAISRDLGATWTSGTPPAFGGVAVEGFAFSGGLIYAAGDESVLVSPDKGINWYDIRTWSYTINVNAIAVSGTNIFAAWDNGQLVMSSDTGQTWQPTGPGGPNYFIAAICASDSNLIATDFNGVNLYVSSNLGNTWTNAISKLPANTSVYTIALIPPLTTGGITRFCAGTSSGLYISIDNGANWNLSDNGIPFYAGAHAPVFSLGVPDASVPVDERTIFANSPWGLSVSTDNGATWTTDNNGMTNAITGCFLKTPAGIFAGTWIGDIYLSTDNGGSWTPVDSGIWFGAAFMAFTTNRIDQPDGGINIFAGGYGGVYISTDNGTSWHNTNTGLTDTFVTSMTANGADVFAGTYTSGVFLSPDNGASWSPVNNGLTNLNIHSLLTIDTAIFAGTDGGIFISVDNGSHWIASNTGLANDTVNAIVTGIAGNGSILAGTSQGIFLSPDYGSHWAPLNVGLPAPLYVSSLAVSGANVLAGTYNGVFFSADSGATWQHISMNLIDTTIYAVAFDGTNIFVGTHASSVWQLPLSSLLPCYSHFTLYPDATTPHHWFALNQATGAAPLSYVWTWGDNSPADTGATPSHVFSDSSYYDICLTITDSTGCTASYCDSSTYIRSIQSLVITVDVVTKLPAAQPTGIPVVQNASVVSVYPNPNLIGSWQLIVDNGLVGSALQVFDDEGRLVFHSAIRNQKSEIVINELPSGIYYLRISNDKVSEVRKLVKIN